MRSPTRRRRGAILALLGLLAVMVPVLLTASPASAGTVTTPNSCTTNVSTGTTAIPVTLTGDAQESVTLGDTFDLTGATLTIDVPSDVLIAGYNLGPFLTEGLNSIPAQVNVTILGSNTEEGSQTIGPISVLGTTTVTDLDHNKATVADNSATPLAVTAPLTDTTWTPSGGAVELSLGDSVTSASITALGISVAFSCTPGTTTPAGCVGAACTGTNEVDAEAFDSVSVIAPETPPVCEDFSTSVGVGQPVELDLTEACSDVNENIDPSTWQLSAPSVGSIAEDSDGVYTYTAPANDPGAPVVLTFSVSDDTDPLDGGPFVSNEAEVSITILANRCTVPVVSDPDGIPGSGDEVTERCALTEILVQPVVGTTMTLDKAPGNILMPPIFLDGDAQVSTGSLRDLEVTNARGTEAGWSLSGFVTDLGAAGGPTVTLPAPFNQTVPACSAAGGSPDPSPADRLCIPGDNLAWSPTASVAHDVIFGDVAEVTPGGSLADDADDWRDQLVLAGETGVSAGLGGLGSVNTLCSSLPGQSGGTFACDAALFLGIPASAGAGTYTGGLVLTLL